MKLSTTELELFCKLPLTNDAGLEEQKNVAAYLARVYEFGGKWGAKNEVKASAFYKQAGEENVGEVPAYQQSSFYFTKLRVFNRARLFLLRNHLVASYFGRAFLNRFFSIAGFGYFIDFCIDSGITLKETFAKARTEEERQLTYWQLRKQRFLNILNETSEPGGGTRLSRMMNSGPWFAINFTAFWLTGGWSSILNVCGFGYDLTHELWDSFSAYRAHRGLYDKVTASIDNKQQKLDFLVAKKCLTPEEEKEKAGLQAKIAMLTEVQTTVKAKTESLINSRVYGFLTVTLVLVGLGLTFFPPTALAGIVLTTIGIGMSVARFLNQHSGTIGGWISAKLFPKRELTNLKLQEEAPAKIKGSYQNCVSFFNEKGRQYKMNTPNACETSRILLPKEKENLEDTSADEAKVAEILAYKSKYPMLKDQRVDQKKGPSIPSVTYERVQEPYVYTGNAAKTMWSESKTPPAGIEQDESERQPLLVSC